MVASGADTLTSLHDALHPDQAAPAEEPLARCVGVTKRGNACQRPAVEGETLCIMCGASMVVAKEVIQRRLLALQEKSVGVLEEIFAASDDRTRLSAVLGVLDRTGFGPKSTIEVTDKENLSSLSAEDLAARLDSKSDHAKSIARRLRTSPRMNVSSDVDDPVSH